MLLSLNRLHYPVPDLHQYAHASHITELSTGPSALAVVLLGLSREEGSPY